MRVRFVDGGLRADELWAAARGGRWGHGCLRRTPGPEPRWSGATLPTQLLRRRFPSEQGSMLDDYSDIRVPTALQPHSVHENGHSGSAVLLASEVMPAKGFKSWLYSRSALM